MKRILCFILAFAAVTFTACNKNTPESGKLPQSAYLIDNKIIDEVCVALEKNGLQNTSVYKE